MRIRNRYKIQVEREGEPELDFLGNPKPGTGVRVETIAVAGYQIYKTDANLDNGRSELQTSDYMKIYCDEPLPAGTVVIVGGRRWVADGNPEDYTHSPFRFNPGLYVIQCYSQEG